jgi:corrinoid protein of di/trimethylamine methyltransferase
MSQEILDRLAKAVMGGDEEAAKKAAQEAIDAKMDPLDAIKNGLSKGMEVIGKKFGNFEVFLPEVMLAADAMKAGIGVLRPYISADKMAEGSKGKVVIGTVYGDIHDIGKNLVATMLEVARYEVYDLGNDIPPKKFLEKAKEVNADIIGMSCLLTPSMYYQKDVIELMKDMGIRDKIWVMVGGAPITPDWTKEIGADGWGRHAEDAVIVANLLMEKGSELAKPVVRGG